MAYVTDHATVAAAERGIANESPAAAAEGVMLLQGIEVTWSGEHVTILSAERFYRGLLTDNMRDVDVRGLELASLVPGREPVVIWNHPHRLQGSSRGSRSRYARGSRHRDREWLPEGHGRAPTQTRAIVALAERHNLALTTGSDHHGWGYAAPGWTLMRIFSWRGSQATRSRSRSSSALRTGGLGSTRVVERRVADPGASTLALGAHGVRALRRECSRRSRTTSALRGSCGRG